MRCIIRIVDGQPFEHPIMVDNFIQAFPDIDINQPLPEGFAWFERKLRPQIQEHEVFVNEQSRYEFDGSVWTDVWDVRDKTQEELNAEISNAYDFLRAKAATQIAFLSDDPEGAAAWAAFSKLVDERQAQYPSQIKTPLFPYKNEEGKWVSLSKSGSAPNVIG
jgi:hypothetical protein